MYTTSVYYKTESGDDYHFLVRTETKKELEILQNIVKSCPETIHYVEDEGKDYDWMLDNPAESLEIALIYPSLVPVDFEIEEKE